MRLLFDHNLSPDLTSILSDLYTGSIHVWDLEMDTAADTRIWDYALDHGFVIVTKDADYRDLSITRGHPPKVIWIRLGSGCSIPTGSAPPAPAAPRYAGRCQSPASR